MWVENEVVDDNKSKGMFDEGDHFDEEPDTDMPEVSEQVLPSTTLQSYLTFLQMLFSMTK